MKICYRSLCLVLLTLLLCSCNALPMPQSPMPSVATACPAMGCWTELTVALKDFIPADYVLEATTPNGERMEVHCVNGEGKYPENYFPRDSYPVCTSTGVEFSLFSPAEVTITVKWSDLEASQTFKPAYEPFRPNGPDCEPVCPSGHITFSLPSPAPTRTPTRTAGAHVCVEAPAGLISWWPADGNANDIQNVNDGAMSNGATFAAGRVGQAFSFDGTTYVSAPATGLPTGDSNRTLELWVKVNTFSDGEAFFAGYGSFRSFDQTYHLGTTGHTLFFSQWGQAIFGPELQPGRWYHVAVTNVGSSVTLYLDGAAVANGELGINTPSGTQLFLGSLPVDPAKRLDGLIDEVAIYNRALSATEIQAIFLAGSSGKCK